MSDPTFVLSVMFLAIVPIFSLGLLEGLEIIPDRFKAHHENTVMFLIFCSGLAAAAVSGFAFSWNPFSVIVFFGIGVIAGCIGSNMGHLFGILAQVVLIAVLLAIIQGLNMATRKSP